MRTARPAPSGPARSLVVLLAGVTALAALAVAGAGCGSVADGEPRIVATTAILSDIASQVAGPDAQVEQLIPDNVSPHEFTLSARDRAGLDDALLVIAAGGGLEAGIPLDEVDAPQFTLTENVGTLLAVDQAGDRSGTERTNGTDPHVWMDPVRVASALPALADAMADADPAHAEGYRERAHSYAERLAKTDAQLTRILSAIPADDRKLVTSHDALGYFADRYGFEIVATAFPASGAEAEASAALINEVETAIRRSGVPAVFTESEDDPEVLELIARETGVKIYSDLFVETPGAAGTYTGMLRHDAQLLVAGLGH